MPPMPGRAASSPVQGQPHGEAFGDVVPYAGRMTGQDRVVVSVCGSDLQARVLIAQLAARGIDATTTRTGVAGPLQEDRIRVLVPASRVDEARTVIRSLEGRTRWGGLLDMRRLLPALIVLGLLLLVISVLVDALL